MAELQSNVSQAGELTGNISAEVKLTGNVSIGMIAGLNGKDGYTPVKGVDYFDGKDGKDGKDGIDGKDGYTPVKGVDYFDGKDGQDGKDGYTPVKGIDYFDGTDGLDGFSPIVAVEDIDGGHRVTITDKEGEKTFDVMDGKDGEGGTGGASVQADWDVNDENDPAYVKNRPFYKETVIQNSRQDVFEGTYTSTPQSDLGGAFAVFLDDVYKDMLIFSREYTVSFNGSEYVGLVGNLAVLPNFYSYGNFSILNPLLGTDYENTGEPFLIAVANAVSFLVSDFTQSTTDEWKMYAPEKYVEKIVKLPKEYMPETIGSKGSGVYAEVFNGSTNTASGASSHAEGSVTAASGDSSHAEGYLTEAIGDASHAEGRSCDAYGDASHAEGWSCYAYGRYSHAEGLWTFAHGQSQHVQGEFNIYDIDDKSPAARAKYAHIVGNGTDEDNRSNAHTLDWNGLGWFAGGLKVGGTGQDDPEAKEVALKEDIATPDWSVNDPDAAGYVKNRTHWMERLFEPIVWDGNTEGRDSVDISIAFDLPAGSVIVYKISDLVLTPDLIDKTTIINTVSGLGVMSRKMYYISDFEVYGIYIGNVHIDFRVANGDYYDHSAVFVVSTALYGDFTDSLGVNIPSAGTYAIQQINAPHLMELSGDVYHPLDERYLPDTYASKEYVEELVANAIAGAIGGGY